LVAQLVSALLLVVALLPVALLPPLARLSTKTSRPATCRAARACLVAASWSSRRLAYLSPASDSRVSARPSNYPWVASKRRAVSPSYPVASRARVPMTTTSTLMASLVESSSCERSDSLASRAGPAMMARDEPGPVPRTVADCSSLPATPTAACTSLVAQAQLAVSAQAQHAAQAQLAVLVQFVALAVAATATALVQQPARLARLAPRHSEPHPAPFPRSRL
jgi:hypothetical protein